MGKSLRSGGLPPPRTPPGRGGLPPPPNPPFCTGLSDFWIFNFGKLRYYYNSKKGRYNPVVVVVDVVVTVLNYGNFRFWKFIGFLNFLILEN